jgi:hypothetical protein
MGKGGEFAWLRLGERIDRIQLARFNEGGDRRSVLGAEIVAGKERILPVKRHAADRTLDRVGIDLDAAVVEEAAKPLRTRSMPGVNTFKSQMLKWCRDGRGGLRSPIV